MCYRYHVPENSNSSQGLVAENVQNSFVWKGVLCFKKSVGNNLDPNPYLQHLWSMDFGKVDSRRKEGLHQFFFLLDLF